MYEKDGQIHLDEFERDVMMAWFGVKECTNYSTPLEVAYKENKLQDIVFYTQEYYKRRGVSKLHLYRWESNKRDNKVLESWTTNLKVAESYSELREGNLIECDVEIDKVLLDINIGDEFEFYWDEEIGIVPCEEVILICGTIKS